ncbi:hypothetical protein QQS21_012445 [Conoideocrella luteorostrata]|uniref:Uncharacterized protein n=1 Tax=Conoideocrella luteorostrata TaxID=1105319 RepID=A0AAJ0CFP7_9HYPO|nr:hypothetical protein QQS21_012445 [Conoideocrella luteorostrata]
MSLIVPEDEDHLLQVGLITKPTPNGFRKVHHRLLFMPDTESDGRQLPFVHVNNVRAGLQSCFFRSIPVHLISHATVLYVGYDYDTASRIWQEWLSRRNTGPILRPTDETFGMDFKAFLVNGIERNSVEAYFDNQDNSVWRELLDDHGMNGDAHVYFMARKMERERMRHYWEGVIRCHESGEGRYTLNYVEKCWCRLIIDGVPNFENWIKESIDARFMSLVETMKLSRERVRLLKDGFVEEPIPQFDAPPLDGMFCSGKRLWLL